MSETFLTAFFRSQFLTRWFILLSHLVDQRLHFLLVFGFIAVLANLHDESNVVLPCTTASPSSQPFMAFRKSGLRRVDGGVPIFDWNRATEQQIASTYKISPAVGQGR